MFARMIDEFKDSTSTAVRRTSLAAVIALALLVTISFLCAAAFVYVLQTYGLIQACLAGAGIFLLVALITAFLGAIRSGNIPAQLSPQSAKLSLEEQPSTKSAKRAVPSERAIDLMLKSFPRSAVVVKSAAGFPS